MFLIFYMMFTDKADFVHGKKFFGFLLQAYRDTLIFLPEAVILLWVS